MPPPLSFEKCKQEVAFGAFINKGIWCALFWSGKPGPRLRISNTNICHGNENNHEKLVSPTRIFETNTVVFLSDCYWTVMQLVFTCFKAVVHHR